MNVHLDISLTSPTFYISFALHTGFRCRPSSDVEEVPAVADQIICRHGSYRYPRAPFRSQYLPGAADSGVLGRICLYGSHLTRDATLSTRAKPGLLHHWDVLIFLEAGNTPWHYIRALKLPHVETQVPPRIHCIISINPHCRRAHLSIYPLVSSPHR